MKTLLITLILALTIPAMAALSPTSREILNAASQLDADRDATVKALQGKPRAQVVTAVREGLATGAPFSLVAARMASAMGLKEVVPDLKKAFQKTNDFELALALGDLANDEQRKALAKEWQAKLEKFESPTRVAVFQTLAEWQIPLSGPEFDKALVDKYPGVRLAAARSFFKTRAKLPVADQISHYKKAFAAKPYQVRLDAMTDYEDLAASDRSAVASAIDGAFKSSCAKETQADVKIECEKILKGAK